MRCQHTDVRSQLSRALDVTKINIGGPASGIRENTDFLLCYVWPAEYDMLRLNKDEQNFIIQAGGKSKTRLTDIVYYFLSALYAGPKEAPTCI